MTKLPYESYDIGTYKKLFDHFSKWDKYDLVDSLIRSCTDEQIEYYLNESKI